MLKSIPELLSVLVYHLRHNGSPSFAVVCTFAVAKRAVFHVVFCVLKLLLAHNQVLRILRIFIVETWRSGDLSIFLPSSGELVDVIKVGVINEFFHGDLTKVF